MITFWEFHDSRLGAIDREEKAILLRFPHAFLITEEKIDGSLNRNGWSQILTVRLPDASLCDYEVEDDEPADIWSGVLSTGETHHSGGVFLPSEYSGPTRLNLTLSEGEEIVIESSGIEIIPIGPPRFVERLSGPSLLEDE